MEISFFEWAEDRLKTNPTKIELHHDHHDHRPTRPNFVFVIGLAVNFCVSTYLGFTNKPGSERCKMRFQAYLSRHPFVNPNYNSICFSL